VPGHWLAHCEGFEVDSPAGRVGFVEEVRIGHDPDRPLAIAVRLLAALGGRLFLLPVEEVEGIIPARERVVVRPSPLLARGELVGGLLERLRERPATPAPDRVARAGAGESDG